MSLEQVLMMHGRGDIRGAADGYRRLLDCEPRCHEAWQGLGLVMHQYGQNEAAIPLIERALALCPDCADYHYHLGEVLCAAAHHVEATARYREAIRLDGTQADYFFGLGNALAELGSSTEAVEAYKQALRLSPDDSEAHNNLGNLLASLGDPDGAREHLRKAVLLSPGYADAHQNLAMVLHESGRTRQALEHARRASELAPGRAEPLLNLGRLLDAAGDPPGAVAAFRAAFERASGNPLLLAAIGDGLRKAGDPRTAVEVYRAAIELEPQATRHRVSICHCLIQLHRFADAESESRKALEIDPGCAPALGTLAVCLQTRGRFVKATALLRRSLELQPALTEAAYLLAADGGYEVSDRELERWLSLAESGGLASEKLAHLYFAIAKVYERRRSYAAAFDYFERANRIKARLYPFDPHRHTDYINRIRNVFTREFFERRRDSGVEDGRPVFIVGMPRCGSTLVEQILSCHPEVTCAGEHPEMREIVRDLPAFLGAGRGVPECCRDLSTTALAELAQRYLASMPQAAGAAIRFTDKMLGNFLRLGVIALLFPRARVVHCVRDPLDTCVSCFTQDFAQGLRFTTNLDNLASFYRDYRMLMTHWGRALPLPIMQLSYESLVGERERTTRALIEFCGLTWDDRCLAPHRTSRDVATASFWQARQPVYQDSVARWRHYEQFLGPLIDGLQQVHGDNP